MKEKEKGTRGITLIALVITIIVMLILVGVTLNVAVGENGLIEKAREAKRKTEGAKADEQVQMAIATGVAAGTDDALIQELQKLNPDINDGNLELYLYGVLPIVDNKYYCMTDNETIKLERIEIVEGNASDWTVVDVQEDGIIIGKKIKKYIGEPIGVDETLVIPNMINGERIYIIEMDGEDLPFYDTSTVEGTIKISDGIIIGRCAFAGASMHTIEFPKVLTGGAIGEQAFTECNNLVTVNINNGVKSVGLGAFLNCINLETVTMSNDVTSLGTSSFFGCSKLTTITLSNNLYYLGPGCFNDCTSLTRITLPDSVTTFGTILYMSACFRRLYFFTRSYTIK